jgi:hypothetical protein
MDQAARKSMNDVLFLDFTVLDGWVLAFFSWNVIGALLVRLIWDFVSMDPLCFLWAMLDSYERTTR